MDNEAQNGLKVDLQNTEMIKDSEGNVLFTPGYLLRKVSKFITGGAEDSLIPVQVWYNQETGKILEQGLPPSIVEELKELDKI